MTPQSNADAEIRRAGRPAAPRGRFSRVMILLTVLGIAVALAVAGAVLLGVDRGGITGFERVDRSALFPGLADRIDEIHGLRITGVADPVHLEKRPQGWRYIQRDGYPVEAGRAARVIEAIAGMTYLYVSTQDEPRHGEYGVARPEESATGVGTTVAVLDQEGAPLARVTLGHPITVPGDTRTRNLLAVRRDDEAGIRLVESDIELPALSLDWLDRRILDVSRTSIAALDIVPPGGEPWRVRRDSEGALYVESGASSADEAERPRVLDEIAAAFENLQFLDVRAVGGVVEAADEVWRIGVVTQEGPTYLMTLYQSDDARWATLFALAPDGEVSREATDFNARHAAWAYRLSPHLAGLLTSLATALSQ